MNRHVVRLASCAVAFGLGPGAARESIVGVWATPGRCGVPLSTVTIEPTAIINATGAWITELPATPERVIAALAEQRRSVEPAQNASPADSASPAEPADPVEDAGA